jgi:hypothetical protein
MADKRETQQIVAGLHAQLAQSREQERRLKDALIRLLKLVDDAKLPR